MPTRRFERITLAHLLLGGFAVVFGLIEHAQAQPVNIPHAPPPPVVNPSSPNTVPQPSYTPPTPSTRSTTPSTRSITPLTPSTVPSGEVTSPANEGPTAYRHARSHRRASATTGSVNYRAGPIVIGPPPVAYSYIGYGYPCAWQRSWDGYWFRTSPCSR
jgi:hypothetical protein